MVKGGMNVLSLPSGHVTQEIDSKAYARDIAPFTGQNAAIVQPPYLLDL